MKARIFMRVSNINFLISNLYEINNQSDIQSQLQKLGLTSTGSIEEDKEQIEEVLLDEVSNMESPSGVQGQQEQTPPEIAAFMTKLGLEPINSKDGDDALITDKLDSLEAVAKTDEDKQEVGDLREEFSGLVASAEAGQSGGQIPQDSTAGIEQLANLNKLFLLT